MTLPPLRYELHEADEGKRVADRDELRGLIQIPCAGCGEHAVFNLAEFREAAMRTREGFETRVNCPTCQTRENRRVRNGLSTVSRPD